MSDKYILIFHLVIILSVRLDLFFINFYYLASVLESRFIKLDRITRKSFMIASS